MESLPLAGSIIRCVRTHVISCACARTQSIDKLAEVKVDPTAAWAAFLRAHAGTVRAIESDLSARRLIPLAWYDVLLELNSAPNRRLRMRELAARVTLSRTRISRVVDELETSGLVEREPDPDDGRGSFASITAEGRAELRRTAPHYLSAIETHFSSLLTATEQRALATALSRVAERHSSGNRVARSGS
jgi:DNA-binding MarR family transcriptional regulator